MKLLQDVANVLNKQHDVTTEQSMLNSAQFHSFGFHRLVHPLVLYHCYITSLNNILLV